VKAPARSTSAARRGPAGLQRFGVWNIPAHNFVFFGIKKEFVDV
jgi:hypothetical protein